MSEPIGDALVLSPARCACGRHPVTGQNPPSAAGVAESMIQLLAG